MTGQSYTLTISPSAVLLGAGLMALHFTVLFGSMAAVLFLLTCLSLVFSRPGAVLPEVRASLFLWALVAWCCLSFLWSMTPPASLRYGIQLGLTFAIAIAAAYRLSMTSLLRVVVVTGLLVGLACLALERSSAGGASVGIFGSKNALAQFSTLNILVGLAIILDHRFDPPWRFLGTLALAMGLLLLVRAESVGALIATAMACFSVLVIARLHRFPPIYRIVMGVFTGLLVMLTIVIILGNFEAFSRFILDLTGKDVTLTGRTVLWEIAFAEIAQYPLLGQGYQGFWVPGNPIAEDIWREFGIASKQGFHFHHTLISNAVEIGLVGVALQAILFYYAFFVILRWAIVSPSAETLFFAGFMVRQFILMNSEVVFFSQFNVVTILTVMAVVYAQRHSREIGTQTALLPGNRPALPEKARRGTYTRAPAF
ncbi:O-antigen ligase family protein [Palleronia abyssalis]|uniref:O-antigen ligase-related domain-containing protein n=1 Tax=Palleronia abyssalis TaxID=1501240 RepID=A0A2R8BZH6_9RHOB|nr:O-antigen ligase family protein [Palleronia abyssalis]SPJ25529.1 hypothetical protein PAA8504_03380 [Palleronia abyssalis]